MCVLALNYETKELIGLIFCTEFVNTTVNYRFDLFLGFKMASFIVALLHKVRQTVLSSESIISRKRYS